MTIRWQNSSQWFKRFFGMSTTLILFRIVLDWAILLVRSPLPQKIDWPNRFGLVWTGSCKSSDLVCCAHKGYTTIVHQSRRSVSPMSFLHDRFEPLRRQTFKINWQDTKSLVLLSLFESFWYPPKLLFCFYFDIYLTEFVCSKQIAAGLGNYLLILGDATAIPSIVPCFISTKWKDRKTWGKWLAPAHEELSW